MPPPDLFEGLQCLPIELCDRGESPVNQWARTPACRTGIRGISVERGTVVEGRSAKQQEVLVHAEQRNIQANHRVDSKNERHRRSASVLLST